MSNKITLIKKENVLNAYDKATSAQKELLENLFGKEMFQPKDITERVKTFEDAVAILGNFNEAVVNYHIVSKVTSTKDIIAFAKLRVIVEALNEGWNPTFSESEYRYYLWFRIYSKDEFDSISDYYKNRCSIVGRSYGNSNAVNSFACARVYDASSGFYAQSSSRLSFKTRELAEYCGEQFIDIWADYIFA